MIYQIKENMFYQNIKVMEKEDLRMDLENHLSISRANKQKVKNLFKYSSWTWYL
jgi:hypothetical protein